MSDSPYTGDCCDSGGGSCTPLDQATRGQNVRLHDQYGCEIALEDKPGSLLHGIPGSDPKRVMFSDGSKSMPLTLPNVQGNTVLKHLGGFLEDGTLSKIEPNPDVAGVQVPVYEDDEWRMVAKNSGEHCFPADEIGIADTDIFSGLAAWQECETGTACLSIVPQCDASKLFATFPGSIILWGGCPELIPENHTICDGKSLIVENWPEAWKNIGYKWGGSGEIFRVPDLRGRVPRGVDNDQLRDQTARQAENGSSDTGIGSYQDSYMWNHSHDSGVDEGNAVRQVRLTLNKKSTTVGNHGTKTITYVQGISKDELEADIDVTVGGPTDWDGCTPDVACNETTMHNAAVYFIMSLGCPGE
jgi:microcystin-dependent protein